MAVFVELGRELILFRGLLNLIMNILCPCSLISEVSNEGFRRDSKFELTSKSNQP